MAKVNKRVTGGEAVVAIVCSACQVCVPCDFVIVCVCGCEGRGEQVR
jgi:hypothetical protein